MNEKTRILLVDDDPHLLQGMSRILKSAGYETIEAANGTDCFRFAIEHKPDLILLDVMLPDINGIEVCKRIKLDKTLVDSYVVLLSSLRTSSDDQAEGLETGADGYIARPVSNRELLARVDSLFRLKRAEESIRKNEERFRRISSMTSDISYSCTKSNNAAYSIDWIMGAVEQITGYSVDDIIALGCWRNLVFNEDLPIFDSKVLGLAPGTSASCELRLAHNTGKVVWVASFAECVLDKGSSDSLHLYGALVDITERKQAEEALAETNKRYRLIAETIHDCFWMATPDIGKIVYVSPAYEKIWGRSCESLYESPTSFIDAIHSDDRDQVIDVLDQHRSEVTSWNAIYRIVWPDGSIRWIEDRGFPVMDENVKWYLNIGVATDITERKRAEEELRNQKQVMEVILDNVPAMIALWDTQGYCRYVNRCLQETLGWSLEELGHHNIIEKCCPDPDYRDYVLNYIASAKGTWSDFSTLTRYGNQIETSWANLALPDGSGIGIGIDITDRKRAEEALRQSEDKFSKAFHLNPDAITITRFVDGIIVSANEGFKQIFGFAEDELIDKSALEINMWDNAEDRNRWIEKLKTKGKVDNFEARFRTKDGDIRYGLISASIIELNGAPHILTVAKDITEHKRTNKALKESEEKYRLLTENMNDVIWQMTPDTVFTYISPSIEKHMGYEAHEVLGRPLWDFITPDSIEPLKRRVAQRINLLLSDREVYYEPEAYELEQKRKDGATVWTEAMAIPVFNNEGQFIGFQGVTRDITERKQADEALRSSEERFRTLFETSNDAIFLSDGPKFIECNPKALQIFGCQEEKDIVGHTPMEFSPEKQPDGLDSKKEMLKYFKSAIESGPQTFNWKHCRKDGLPFDAVVTLNSLTLKGKAYLQGSVRDITESKRTEEALRESEEKFSKAFHLNPDAITITRFVDGIIVSANEGVQEILGFAEDELIGKSALEINIWDSPEDRNRWIEKLKAEGKVANFQARFRTKDGGIRYGLISASIIEFNRAPHILTVARDITERVRAEEERESLRSQLLQAQKMEAIGILAGGVAHDFNNLLQIALGYSEILLNGKDPDHQDYRNLHTINTSARRGADLVQRLMVFSRKGDTKPRALDLNHEVTQIKKLLDRTIPKMIAIELSLESWLPVINADPVQVEQILLNLAINAKDAMPESGGKLTIETRNVTLDEEYCRTHLEAKQGQYIMISVSDTGHGMSQETVQHIFEPFFTTKGAGKGTGLGLAMVYGIMKHHEGFINCYSELGHGTTFRIYFPVVQMELEDLEQESAVPQGGSETILLVDDEEFVCDIGSQILTRAGYTVLTATNGKEALDLYRNQKSDISLVILDLIMPEMGGKECFQELVNINSKVKVILSSGFLSDGTTEDATVLGVKGLVEKPYNMRQLLETVREVLDED
jgi:two-component system, cell cycle sensor histidine kinase and response regulator CckA